MTVLLGRLVAHFSSGTHSCLLRLLLSKASGSPAVQHADIGLTGKDPAINDVDLGMVSWGQRPSFDDVPLMSIAYVKYADIPLNMYAHLLR